MAPFLATLIQMGLPYIADVVTGMAKDKAEGFIKEKTGVDLDLSSVGDVSENELEKLRHWNDHDLKKQAEANRHEEAEMEHELNFFRAEMEDKNSAREMQKTALQQDDLFSKRYVYYLATFWSLVGAVYIFMITFMDIPEENVRFADTVLGFLLGTIVATVINFFFGSSKGSKDKTDSMERGLMQGLKEADKMGLV